MTVRALIAALNRARRRGRPVLLDLFCKAGGAAAGYHAAGYDVIGCDVEPQPRFPFPFIQADAFDVLRNWGAAVDVVHASPPCQGYSVMAALHETSYPLLIPAVRDALRSSGAAAWVIENVEGARAELREPVTLCGTMFGLRVRRHRCFEVSPARLILTPQCDCRGGVVSGRLVGHRVSGKVGPGRTKPPRSTEAARRAAIGVPWMSTREARQAIPPAYTRYLGEHLLGGSCAVRRVS